MIHLDNGNYEKNVEISRIFKLVEELVDKPDFKAKKCSVVGIQPTGTDNGEWSNLSKAFTAETLNDNCVHVEFKSTKKPNDSFDTCIYIDAKKQANVFNIKSMPISDNEYVRFADILNCKGLAFLTEKK